jgi:hypothetical protein
MKFAFAVSTALALAFAAPASATVFDAFTSFDGTQGAGGFQYGFFDGTAFTAFTSPSNCSTIISDTICLNNGGLPGAFKSTTGAHTSGTVLVPGNALVLHPGSEAGQAAAILFTLPTASNFTVDLSAFVADTNPSGVNVTFFSVGGTLPVGTLSAANPTLTFNSPAVGGFPANFQFGVAIEYAGTYSNDSTGVNFTVTTEDAAAAVPEPATWGMMLVGFGLVGAGMRRRQSTAVAA